MIVSHILAKIMVNVLIESTGTNVTVTVQATKELTVLKVRLSVTSPNQPYHESDDRTLLLCVFPMRKIWHFSGKI